MKRRLAVRDRFVWVVGIMAVGGVVYLVLPIWIIAAALVMMVSVPLVLRRSRRIDLVLPGVERKEAPVRPRHDLAVEPDDDVSRLLGANGRARDPRRARASVSPA